MDAPGWMRFYDRDGQPITAERWAQLRRDMTYRRIAQDALQDGRVYVSTVLLGYDMCMGEGDRPMIFETMVWANGEAVEQVHYATAEEAIAGHQEILGRLEGESHA